MEKKPGLARRLLRPDETLDSLLFGRLWLIQTRRGYRLSLDALLLADFVEPTPSARLADLGTGCGVIPLLLFKLRPFASAVAVEIQHRLAEIARRNVALNGAEKAVSVIEADLRDLPCLLPGQRFDLVVSNPPYLKTGVGRLNPLEEKALARHEVACTLQELVSTAERLLAPGGRFALVYPAPRLPELERALSAVGLTPAVCRDVRPRPDAPPFLLLLEASRQGGWALETLPPLDVRTEEGVYTEEMIEIFRGRRLLGRRVSAAPALAVPPFR